MEYIKAVNFTGLKYSREGEEKSKESLRIMAEETHCNTVILVLGALQDTAYSDQVDYKHDFMPSDRELKDFIKYAKYLRLNVILKPFINCKDGTWRAYINFFDYDVVCEPKWSTWFRNYTEYQLHYAEIAEETGCEMFVAGSEMVMAEHKEMEWRELFRQIRNVYGGLLCYNTDKYQENRVRFWDAVDIISSSGYYPIDSFETQLDRIEAVAVRYQKPFFFGEMGCKSSEGSSLLPNEWMAQRDVALEEQAEYYRDFFQKCRNRDFIAGIGIWDWHNRLYAKERAMRDTGFSIYGKPVCGIIKSEWSMDSYRGNREDLRASNIA